MSVKNVLIIQLLICACWNPIYACQANPPLHFEFTSDRHKTKLVIDNDAGADDAMAIFIALLNEKYFNGPELVALTTVNGNCEEDKVCLNNQRILNVAQRKDVPIYRGAKDSLVITHEDNNYYGIDGLGEIGNEYDDDLVPAKNKHAVIKLIELAKKYKKNLQVITIGTLTNIAIAIKLDPLFLDRIGQLYVGAGHIQSDDLKTPEFNARMDVEAYEIVVKNGRPDKVTVLPFSQVKQYLNITKEWRENVLGAINNDIIKALNKFERISLAKEDVWHDLDPALVAAVIKPDLIEEHKYSNNSITLCGDSRGLNTNGFGEKDANVKIIYSIHMEKYKQFLLDVFSAHETSAHEQDKEN